MRFSFISYRTVLIAALLGLAWPIGTAADIGWIAAIGVLSALLIPPILVTLAARDAIGSRFGTFAGFVALAAWVWWAVLLVLASLAGAFGVMDQLGTTQSLSGMYLLACAAVIFTFIRQWQRLQPAERWLAFSVVLGLLVLTVIRLGLPAGEEGDIFALPLVASAVWLASLLRQGAEHRARRILAATGRGAAYGALSLCGVLALLGFVNTFDQKLDPEIEKFRKVGTTSKPPALKDNAFYHMVGLNSERGDPHQHGIEYWREVGNANGKDKPWPTPPGGSVKIPGICTEATLKECAVYFSGAPRKPDGTVVLHENQQLLARYRTLLAAPTYLESPPRTLRFDAPVFPLTPLNVAQSILLLDVSRRIHAKEWRAFEDLERSLLFSRKMLEHSSTLLHKSVAAAHVRRAALFAAELIAEHRPPPGPYLDRLQEALRPLSPGERSLLVPLRSEFRQLDQYVSSCTELFQSEYIGGKRLSWAICALVKENATLNVAYREVYANARAHDGASPDVLLKAARKTEDFVFPSEFSSLYNPGGKFLLTQTLWDMGTQYHLKMHDLDAVLRMVAVQAAAAQRREKVPADIAAIQAKLGPSYANPYTGKPFEINPQRRVLSFEPKEPRSQKAKPIEVRL